MHPAQVFVLIVFGVMIFIFGFALGSTIASRAAALRYRRWMKEALDHHLIDESFQARAARWRRQ